MIFDSGAGRVSLLIQLINHKRNVIEKGVLIRIVRLFRRICSFLVQGLHIGIVVVAADIRRHAGYLELSVIRDCIRTVERGGYIDIPVFKFVEILRGFRIIFFVRRKYFGIRKNFVFFVLFVIFEFFEFVFRSFCFLFRLIPGGVFPDSFFEIILIFTTVVQDGF